MSDLTSNSTNFLVQFSGSIETAAVDMMSKFSEAQAAMIADPSDPTKLANFQAYLAEYTQLRTAQSNIVKAYKDIGAGIIQNMR